MFFETFLRALKAGGGILVALLFLAGAVWAIYMRRGVLQRRLNQPQQNGGQQAAGGGGSGPLIGFFFFAAAALSLPLGYFLPFPWNGMTFTTLTTAAFFLKMRYRTPGANTWGGVWEWLTHRRALYTRDADNQRRLTGYSYRS